jgi:hypothetical protein
VNILDRSLLLFLSSFVLPIECSDLVSSLKIINSCHSNSPISSKSQIVNFNYRSMSCPHLLVNFEQSPNEPVKLPEPTMSQTSSHEHGLTRRARKRSPFPEHFFSDYSSSDEEPRQWFKSKSTTRDPSYKPTTKF